MEVLRAITGKILGTYIIFTGMSECYFHKAGVKKNSRKKGDDRYFIR